MNHTKEMSLIKVEDLVPSPSNVRRYSAGQVEELAALTDSQGVLQNLIVTEQMVGRRAGALRPADWAGETRSLSTRSETCCG